VTDVTVDAPPQLPANGVRGVNAVLRFRGATCLERAFVLQSWYAAHGWRREIIIGVTGSTPTFMAHAWLEGEAVTDAGPFHELLRMPFDGLQDVARRPETSAGQDLQKVLDGGGN
jgi:hypothetical protein